MSKVNDEYWEQIFEDYRILDEIKKTGVFEISADSIKQYREPRLMTKFDSKEALPEIFKQNNFRILPNSRGTYLIGDFKAYASLDYTDDNLNVVELPEYVQSFDSFNVTSESVALNVAQMTGMIDHVIADITGDNSCPAVATITGRLSSGKLEYSIDLEKSKESMIFKVDNSQVEIDAGFETLNSLAIIEAKSYIPDDFMIRQLYYPYLIYSNLNTGKEVIPIFLTYSDEIYAFHVFEFTEEKNYSSIKKKKQINFIVDEDLNLTTDAIMSISKNSSNERIEKTFPQADKFTRVLDLLNRIDGKITKDETTEIYNFNERQSDYYLNALAYIGLVERTDDKTFSLTKLGTDIQKMPNSNKRNRIIIEQILNDKLFNQFFQMYIDQSGKLNKEEVVDILLKNAYRVKAESTAQRRYSTIRSWLEWIIMVTE